jgi:xanthine/CO dehydrogenase XdhC/CoxF family maturation factor
MAEGNVMDVSSTEMSNLSKDDDVLSEAALWREQGREVALATVVKTWGSSPRPVGSHLAIDGNSNFVGSVSGGCIEGAVIHEALEVMQDGKPRVLKYGVTHEMAWEIGLACGGQVHVYVEKIN